MHSFSTFAAAFRCSLLPFVLPPSKCPLPGSSDDLSQPHETVDGFLDFYLVMTNYATDIHMFEHTASKSIMDICTELLHSAIIHAPFLGVLSRTLRILSRNEENCRYLGNSDVIKCLCSLLRFNQLPENVVVHMFATLANLALVDSNRASMKSNNVVQLLVTSISNFRNSLLVLPELLAALSNLSCYPENISELGTSNGHVLVLSLLQKNPRDKSLLVHGLHVLASSQNFSAPDKNLLLQVVTDSLTFFPYDESILYAGLSTLGNFFANEGSVADKTLFTILFDIMHRYQQNSNVLIAGVFATAQMLNCLRTKILI